MQPNTATTDSATTSSDTMHGTMRRNSTNSAMAITSSETLKKSGISRIIESVISCVIIAEPEM